MKVGCVIFGMKRKKKPKNMLEITVYKAGMTWQFERISCRHTSRRIYGRYISSMWRLSSSHDTHSPEPTIKIDKFMVRWPRTPGYVFWAWAEPIGVVCADARAEWRPLKGGATVHRQPLSTLHGMFVQPFYFISYYFLKFNMMNSFLIFKRHIIAGWGRDTGTILRPTWILIWICGWR
jgi:hypothetical protein